MLINEFELLMIAGYVYGCHQRGVRFWPGNQFS